ncbi:MAG: hypothetical protein WC510_07750 [Candidatus Omnitrophota bacterium]
MKKRLFVFLDGLDDLPDILLNQKNILSFRSELIRSEGAFDTGVFLLSFLGYDVNKYYTGSGPLEALACGLDVYDGNLALKVSLASCAQDGKSIKGRFLKGDLGKEDILILAEEVNSQVALSSATFELNLGCPEQPGGALVIRGIRSKLSGCVINTDPAYERRGLFNIQRENPLEVLLESAPLGGYEENIEAKEAAFLVNEFTRKSYAVLSGSFFNKKRITEGKLPVNIILSSGAGDRLPPVPLISSFYGLRCAFLTQAPLGRAISRLAGIDLLDAPESCGHADVDYSVWAKLALESLDRYDCLFVHIKYPDQGLKEEKTCQRQEVMQAVDKFFFGYLISVMDSHNILLSVFRGKGEEKGTVLFNP